MAATVATGIADALTVLAGLRARGEEIADEWQYVVDLESVWANRLRQVAEARGAEPLPDAAERALRRLALEAASIGDPHRAIDWLSTFPQATLVALGEPA
jgi:hypothetical protein